MNILWRKSRRFFFIPFWPLLREKFRVLVFFLGTDQHAEDDVKEEDEKKDLRRALLLSLVFDENDMIKEVFFVSSYGDLLRLFFSVVVLNALS